jgi:hypothetical protein
MSIFDNAIFLYADPGAGALLLQMLMAALFGGLFFFRRVRDKVFGLFGKKPAESVEAIAEESEATEIAEDSTNRKA